jgi:hypothetical protein
MRSKRHIEVTDITRLHMPSPVAIELREQLRSEIRMGGQTIATLPLKSDPMPEGEQYEAASRRLRELTILASKVGWETPYPARDVVLEGDEECDLAVQILRTRMDALIELLNAGKTFDHDDAGIVCFDPDDARIVYLHLWLQVTEADQVVTPKMKPASVSAHTGWLHRLAGKCRPDRKRSRS